MRHDDWQNRLTDLINEARNRPFDFAEWNCLQWACAGIEAVTGNNPHDPIRGRYKTPRGALSVLRRTLKADSLEAFLCAAQGQETRSIAFARPGDVVLVQPGEAELDLPYSEPFGRVPGICNGQLSYFVGENGLVQVETFRLSAAIWVL